MLQVLHREQLATTSNSSSNAGDLSLSCLDSSVESKV